MGASQTAKVFPLTSFPLYMYVIVHVHVSMQARQTKKFQYCNTSCFQTEEPPSYNDATKDKGWLNQSIQDTCMLVNQSMAAIHWQWKEVN